jgi:hypothetical protein
MMKSTDDDPNTIPGMGVIRPEPCRIYAQNHDMFALVDEIDYQSLVQWKWSPKWSRGGKKVYLRRVLHEGNRIVRVQRTLFLHQAVMKRKGDKPPSPDHTIIDHRDGDGLNCQRENLVWATHKENRHNIHGVALKQRAVVI